MKRDISKQLVEFTFKTKYEDLPEEVIEFTKLLLLKTVAGMLAGSTKPSGKKMAKLIKGKKLPDEVSVIGGGFRTSLWEAVFLNGFFGHVSELEDDRVDESGAVSWDIALVPLLLPLAEKLGISGKKLLEALATGLEVHVRTCQFSPGHLGQLLAPGAIGPAAGAAKAMGLNLHQLSDAFGLAMSSAPLWLGSYGTDAHFFESSIQLLQGMMAAEMAKMGLSGNADVATYLTQYMGADRVYPEKIVKDLGKRWMLKEICVKKYPVCFTQHRQIDMVIALKKKHNLSFEEVETIEIHAQRSREEICNRPDPKNEGDLQFSFQHNLALAMLYGDVTLEHINPEAVEERKLKDVRSKVKFVAAYSNTAPRPSMQEPAHVAAFSPTAPGPSMQEPAHVVLKMKDGRIFTEDRKYPIGHPKDPLTTAQIQELCNKFTKGILTKRDMAKTSQVILNLEKQKNVMELMNVLRIGG
jgi:2-methylcitrate dehydratase PrpD